MKTLFSTIGLIGKLSTQDIANTCLNLLAYLQQKVDRVIIDKETADYLSLSYTDIVSRETLGKASDLVIVIGGDGSLLHAARAVVDDDTPIIGINRGRLGFLTDINPSDFRATLDDILAGHFIQESRFLLEASTLDKKRTASALNDVVIASSDSAHMMEYEVYVDEAFMCSERADGLIIATPTGSTAYALSGGGPIIQPSLDAIVIVSMFPHSLTHRPIVIPGNSKIRVVIGEKTNIPAKLSVDGQVDCALHANDQIIIEKKTKQLQLLHPLNYDYFANVRSKLHWGRKLELSHD